MKKAIAAFALSAMAAAGSVSTASSQNVVEAMGAIIQCRAQCNAQYLQCLGSANQFASTPADGLNQLASNFQGSTQCGTDAIQCKSSCQ